MKTSKIKEVKNVSDPWGERKILYHKLEMENGDKIDIGKIKKQEIGWELTYEIIEEGQHEFNKAKAVAPDNFRANTSSSFKSNDDRQISIIRQSSLKSAVEYLKGAEASLEEVYEVAEKFIDWVNLTPTKKEVKLEITGRKEENDLPF